MLVPSLMVSPKLVQDYHRQHPRRLSRFLAELDLRPGRPHISPFIIVKLGLQGIHEEVLL
jgi:hypothetical protein